jgi:hypothetical protein
MIATHIQWCGGVSHLSGPLLFVFHTSSCFVWRSSDIVACTSSALFIQERFAGVPFVADHDLGRFMSFFPLRPITTLTLDASRLPKVLVFPLGR